MNRRTLGILAGVVGSALGTWWWARQRMAGHASQHLAARDHGTVIFKNTPTAVEGNVI